MTLIFEDVLRAMLVKIGVVDNRVFLHRAPQVPAEQAKIPYIVFFMVGPSPMHSHSGPCDVFDRTYQISIFDSSQSRGIAISEVVRQRLDGNGIQCQGVHDGIHFGGIFYRAQTSSYENDTKLFQFILDFRILFRSAGLPTIPYRAVNTAVKTAVPTKPTRN